MKKKERTGRTSSAWIKWGAAVACVAILVGAWFAIPALRGGTTEPVPVSDEPSTVSTEPSRPDTDRIQRVMATYPSPVAPDMTAQEYMYSNEHTSWQSAYMELVEATQGLSSGMNDYCLALMGQLLPAEDENTICSPLNTYIAFSVLAEVTDGATRQQILDMLGAESIDAVRANITALWNSNYADTPSFKSLLANSLWLRDDVTYNGDTLSRLAETYYASTFRGTMGAPEMDEALRTWTDDNTGGLLKEYTKDMKLDEDTVLDIVSTLYYKATWIESFKKEANTRETFHGTRGDTTVEMMHDSESMGVYQTDAFTAVAKRLQDSGSMYFLLPNEGVDVSTLATDPDMIKLLNYDDTDEHWSHKQVRLSVPKFKVSAKSDLLDVMQALGVTDALDPAVSDFTPLTTDMDQLYVSKAEHAATLEVDENGVLGAAYTEVAVKAVGMPMEYVELVLDRPFMFVVTGADGSMLFSGIVRNI